MCATHKWTKRAGGFLNHFLKNNAKDVVTIDPSVHGGSGQPRLLVVYYNIT